MSMKIQVSKVFARFINRTAKEMYFAAKAEVVDLSVNEYQMHMGDVYEGESDFNWKTGKIKAIRVVYPYGYFANPLYISTAMLLRECRRRNVGNVEELKEMIRDMVEV